MFEKPEDETTDRDCWPEPSFTWEIQVVAAAAAWALPGAVVGGILAILIQFGGPPESGTVVGAITGAFAGGLMESGYWA
ncbi:hypothetical protein [Fimbriiglobus ruber]|uniref:Uncharacterized protein n=1 Tax=Fimbriiglobus ruber TaxID=1908690 RepID=A0A225ED76_9BACT|nr:hypothetical protein [Fimbriiglobus ruber]OWK46395.1 hypothetical protein FRUB_00094 [Fimbriiglobus ruber]